MSRRGQGPEVALDEVSANLQTRSEVSDEQREALVWTVEVLSKWGPLNMESRSTVLPVSVASQTQRLTRQTNLPKQQLNPHIGHPMLDTTAEYFMRC